MSYISCLQFPGVNKTTCERLFHRRANSLTQADELFSALSTSSSDQYKGFGGCLGKGGVSDWGKESWRGPGCGDRLQQYSWESRGSQHGGYRLLLPNFCIFSISACPFTEQRYGNEAFTYTAGSARVGRRRHQA